MPEVPMFEREYDVHGLAEKILLQIYEPKPDGYRWVCEHRLTGPEIEFGEPIRMMGVDKLHAFTLTLQYIPAEIQYFATKLGRKVSWMTEPRLRLI